MVLQSSTRMISWTRRGGERLRTLCTERSRADHTSSTKHMMMLVLGRSSWTCCSEHLQQQHGLTGASHPPRGCSWCYWDSGLRGENAQCEIGGGTLQCWEGNRGVRGEPHTQPHGTGF